jgi:hypothetical protein
LIHNVHKPRTTNSSLFVTVLSACLGLVVVSVPVQALAQHLATMTDASLSAKAKIEVSSISKIQQPSSKQARKLAATRNSHLSLSSRREYNQPDVILYRNTKALTNHNQVLIVTHLPRAALSELLAKKPAARLSRVED